MKKGIIILLLAIIPVFLSSETNAELARLYFDEAMLNFNNEDFILAKKNLDESIDFSDNLSESWYLSGLISEHEGNRLKALEYYEVSIEMGDVYKDYYRDLVFRYIRLLNITGRHKLVLDFYKSHRIFINRFNSIQLLMADSAYKYGLLDYSFEIAQDVYKRNPDNLKSLIYMLRTANHDQYYTSMELNFHSYQKDDLDELLFQELIVGRAETKTDKLTEIYEKIFGDTPFYYSLKDASHPSVERSRNLLVRSYGGDFLDDGVYFGDYNFDGISDEILTVTENEMTYLKDYNQDNITDLSITFSDNVPESIFINRDGISYQFKYSDYPFVEEIQYNNQSLRRVYKISPGIQFSPLDDDYQFTWKYDITRQVWRDDLRITPVSLLQLSYEFDEYPAEGKEIFRTYHVKDGEIYHIKEDSQKDGHFDHFLNISAWIPESGLRDINGDGIIDLYEYYENGKLSGIAVDWNNNGKSEYLEDWSVLEIKSWDFNEDSFIDADYIHSLISNSDYRVSAKNGNINKYDNYSWDFSFENFWFINN